MKPKTIGVVGGAGPMAAVSFLDRLFRLAQSKYRCHKDADFPKVILISYPFSDMLTSEADAEQVQKELQSCLDKLRADGADVLAIACNTLHAFLTDTGEDLIHLLKIAIEGPPLVLCTSTSRRTAIHQRFFPCRYLENAKQHKLDEIIEMILRGEEATGQLKEFLKEFEDKTFVLGCTELSLYTDRLRTAFPKKQMIDPIEIVAEKLLERSFS